MKTTNEFSGELTNPTLKHLADWLEAIALYLEEEHAFADMEALAKQMEYWRTDFIQSARELKCHWGDLVTVVTYGEDVILISDQRSKEFIKITKTGKEVSNG